MDKKRTLTITQVKTFSSAGKVDGARVPERPSLHLQVRCLELRSPALGDGYSG